MRFWSSLLLVATIVATAGCESPLAPDATGETPPVVVTSHQQTGPANECYGRIVSDIASTWPWAHGDHESFPPPPGAISLWLETFERDQVREFQQEQCG